MADLHSFFWFWWVGGRPADSLALNHSSQITSWHQRGLPLTVGGLGPSSLCSVMTCSRYFIKGRVSLRVSQCWKTDHDLCTETHPQSCSCRAGRVFHWWGFPEQTGDTGRAECTGCTGGHHWVLVILLKLCNCCHVLKHLLSNPDPLFLFSAVLGFSPLFFCLKMIFFYLSCCFWLIHFLLKYLDYCLIVLLKSFTFFFSPILSPSPTWRLIVFLLLFLLLTFVPKLIRHLQSHWVSLSSCPGSVQHLFWGSNIPAQSRPVYHS